MRALQIDPKHGSPQRWAQMCFYACTASVCVQTILVLIMPFCTECECKEGVSEGDVEFIMENQTLAGIITGIRYLALLGLYGGFTAVICSIFESARMTVMFAPMLSMLFIGTRMRALQLTKATDGTIPVTAGPQTWVQDGMFLATWSV